MFNLNFKQIALAGLLPLISAASPEAGKAISDANAALSDGKLSEDEAVTIINDGINVAKGFWSKGAQVLDDAKDLLIELHTGVEPRITKLIADAKAIQ